jgi:uncharacterized protein (TIGR03067 family)
MACIVVWTTQESPWDDGTKRLLVGRWELTEMIISGKAVQPEGAVSRVFREDGVFIRYRDGIEQLRGVYLVDREMNQIWYHQAVRGADGKPIHVLGLIEVKGDELRICFSSENEVRPLNMESTPENRHALLVFKREKKK